MLEHFRKALFGSVVAALLAGCDARVQPGEFSKALGELVNTSRVTAVDLAAVPATPWDEMYALGPYSTRKQNCAALRLGRLACWYVIPATVGEGEYFLVFRSKGAITHTEHHWRSNGDFSSPSQVPSPILRSNAKFAVKLASNRAPAGQAWYQLEHEAKP